MCGDRTCEGQPSEHLQLRLYWIWLSMRLTGTQLNWARTINKQNIQRFFRWQKWRSEDVLKVNINTFFRMQNKRGNRDQFCFVLFFVLKFSNSTAWCLYIFRVFLFFLIENKQISTFPQMKFRVGETWSDALDTMELRFFVQVKINHSFEYSHLADCFVTAFSWFVCWG